MAETNTRIVVLRALEYNFKDDNQNQISGCKVHYIIPDMPTFNDNTVGYSVACGVLPVAKFNVLAREVPAIYDGDFDMLIGQNGQIVLKLKDLKYVTKFPVLDLFNIALGEQGYEAPV